MKRVLTDFLSLPAYIRMIRVDPCSIYDWLSSYKVCILERPSQLSAFKI